MDNEVHFQGVKVIARIGIVLAACGLLFIGIRVAYSHTQVAEADSWVYECVDCPKFFDYLTDRSIRVAADGYPRVAYGGDHLYYAWFDGSAWQYETVDASPGVGEYAALALDSNGYAHISYYDAGNMDLKYAYQDGAGWHVDTLYTNGDAGIFTSIDVDDQGYPHISFLDRTNSQLSYAYQDSISWHIEEVDTSIYWINTSIAVDQDGFPHITYHDEYDLKYATKDAGGWHTAVVDSNGGWSSLTLDSSGYPHISYTYWEMYTTYQKYAYQDVSGWHIETFDFGQWSYNSSIALDTNMYPHISYQDSAENLTYAYKDGSGWHLETVDDVGFYSSLALDADDHPHISYFDYWNLDVKYATYDLAGWHVELLDVGSSVPDNYIYPAPVVDTDDTVHVSYYHESDDSLKYAHRDQGTWQVETIEDNLYLDAHSSMDIDSQGYAHISYFNANLKYAYQDAQGWHLETADSSGYLGTYSSLVLDESDYPHISYIQEIDGDLKYAFKDASGWHAQVVDSLDYVGMSTSIALDQEGYPHISFYAGWPNYDLKYAYQDASGWHVETAFGDGDTGTYSSLVLDSNDYPHISFYDSQFGDLLYVYQDASGWHDEVVDSQGDTGRFTSIDLDLQDLPAITYLDVTNGNIKYASKDDAGWTITTVDHVGYGKSSQVIDPFGNIHLVYDHGLNRDLMYAVNLANVVSPTLITISGPELGFVETSYTFTGTVEPISTTSPIDYVWQATGMSPVTHTGGLTDTITFSWVTPGWKTIQVTATGVGGTVTDTLSVTLTDISISGLLAVNNSPTILGETTRLTATVELGTNISYAWAFGDGVLTQGPVVEHIYATPGEYSAIVTVTNTSNVLTATTTVTVDQTIEGLAVSIEDATVKVGEIVRMRAEIDQGSNVVYVWDFGDGSTASGQEVTHIYTQEGEYAVSVTATNSVDSATADATIRVTPVNFPIYLPLVTQTD